VKYRIKADRDTFERGYVWFEVDADSEEEAIKVAEQGDAEEVDWIVGKTNGSDSNFGIVPDLGSKYKVGQYVTFHPADTEHTGSHTEDAYDEWYDNEICRITPDGLYEFYDFGGKWSEVIF